MLETCAAFSASVRHAWLDSSVAPPCAGIAPNINITHFRMRRKLQQQPRPHTKQLGSSAALEDVKRAAVAEIAARAAQRAHELLEQSATGEAAPRAVDAASAASAANPASVVHEPDMADMPDMADTAGTVDAADSTVKSTRAADAASNQPPPRGPKRSSGGLVLCALFAATAAAVAYIMATSGPPTQLPEPGTWLSAANARTWAQHVATKPLQVRDTSDAVAPLAAVVLTLAGVPESLVFLQGGRRCSGDRHYYGGRGVLRVRALTAEHAAHCMMFCDTVPDLDIARGRPCGSGHAVQSLLAGLVPQPCSPTHETPTPHASVHKKTNDWPWEC